MDFIFLPPSFGFACYFIGLWPKFTFWNIDWEKKERNPSHSTLRSYTSNQETKQTSQNKEKKNNQNIPLPSNFTPSRTTERRRRAESRTTTPERLVSMRNIRPLARSTLVRLMGNGDQIDIPPPPPSLRFFLQQKNDILSHKNNRSAIVPLREQQLRKKKITITSIRATTTSTNRTENSLKK